MTDNSPPSRNYANDGSLLGVIRLALTKFLQNDIDDMLPAQVIAYNATTNRAQVQPLIVQVTTDNIQIQRAQIASVPVYKMGGGSFVISFPVNSGDLGWIKANDRDISLFKTKYQQSPPNTQRKHKFSDAVFIPDSMLNGVSLVDPTKMCLQSYDGTMAITIGDGQITLKAPTKINFETPLVVYSGVFEVQNTASAGVAATITGALTTTGEVTSTLGGTHTLTEHVHGGVQSGSSNTSTPTG